MKGYQGDKLVQQKDTEFKNYDIVDWMMYFLEAYAGIDGSHHKDWVFDQIARVRHGTPIIIKEATWAEVDGNIAERNWRIETGEPSQKYIDWVAEMKAGDDGPDTYEYDEGIVP